MGELEDRLKAIDAGTTPEKPMIKSAIEKALEEADVEDAKDIIRAQARRRKAEEELRAREADQRLRQQGGVTMQDQGKTEEERAAEELKAKTERIEQAKALYTTCIESGGDPTACAQVVAGIIPSPQAGMAAPPATSITELVTALKTLDELRGDKGGELKGVLEKLTTKFEDLANRPPADPVAMAQQQAQAISATYEALKTLGIIKEPVVTTSDGKSLEVVKEEHHHDERMEELRIDREWKQETTKTLSELPERIGRGIAGQIREEGSHDGSAGELEYITCQEEGCGTKIYITPDTKGAVTCPKCGTIYSRKGTVETK